MILTTMKKSILFLFLGAILYSCHDNPEDDKPVCSIPIDSRSSDQSSDDMVCGTRNPTTPPPSWYFEPNTRSLGMSSPECLNVYIYIIRDDSNDNRLSLNTVQNQIMDELATYYDGTGIYFHLLGGEYINSEHYNHDYKFNTGSGLDNFFGSIVSKDNALNIYVFTSDSNFPGNLGGVSKDIISNACVISPRALEPNIISHEIGHSLGLYHTHHGTDPNESGIPEYVDGSNSTIAGDYIADTPADPNIWESHVNCTYTITAKDAHGDTYQPNPNNLMSYAHNACKDEFSMMQTVRMHGTIENELQNLLFKETIEGTNHILDNGTYQVNNSTNTINNVVWEITTNYYDVNSNQFISNVTTTNNLTLTINGTNDLIPRLYEISAEVSYSDASYSSQSNALKATNDVTSPYFGTLYWSCGALTNKQSNYTGSTGTIELETNSTKEFTAHKYSDVALFEISNPTIDATGTDVNAIYNGNNTLDLETYDISGPGELQVTVTHNGKEGLPFTIPYIIVDINTLSLDMSENILTISSENPGSQVRTNAVESISSVEILNTSLQTIKYEQFESAPDISMNISDLSSGTYYVKIKYGDRDIYKKLIK